MQLIIPLNPSEEEYNSIVHMNKDELVFALKNYVPKHVLGYPVTYHGQCPNCKRDVKRTDYFCSKCGKHLQHTTV